MGVCASDFLLLIISVLGSQGNGGVCMCVWSVIALAVKSSGNRVCPSDGAHSHPSKRINEGGLGTAGSSDLATWGVRL